MARRVWNALEGDGSVAIIRNWYLSKGRDMRKWITNKRLHRAESQSAGNEDSETY